MKTIFTTVITAFIITGCSTTSPQISEYTLTTEKPQAQHSTSETSSKTLQYQRIKAPASLSSKSILYIKNDQEIGSYLYSTWIDSPVIMMERSTLGALQESRLFANVIPIYSQTKGDYVLESDLNALYHRILDTTSSEGTIDITYRLIDLNTRQCIESKRFVVTNPSDTQDAKGGVKALKKSMEILNGQIVLWLNQTIEMKKLK
ncbi:MAG TPA: ABC-type transport auxiliary lipoprotein family protein [Sulfuricurvum sp.]|nr:ABC-type transport auxiliary lipoprotein family protein [Sulfuricurvum sp.]